MSNWVKPPSILLKSYDLKIYQKLESVKENNFLMLIVVVWYLCCGAGQAGGGGRYRRGLPSVSLLYTLHSLLFSLSRPRITGLAGVRLWGRHRDRSVTNRNINLITVNLSTLLMITLLCGIVVSQSVWIVNCLLEVTTPDPQWLKVRLWYEEKSRSSDWTWFIVIRANKVEEEH